MPTEREVFIAVGYLSVHNEDEIEIKELLVWLFLVRLILLPDNTVVELEEAFGSSQLPGRKEKKISSWGKDNCALPRSFV